MNYIKNRASKGSEGEEEDEVFFAYSKKAGWRASFLIKLSNMRTGIATVPLDYGRCPYWLFERMKRLGFTYISIGRK